MNFKTKILSVITVVISCLTISAQPGTSWQLTGPDLFPINASGQVNGIGRVSQLKFHPTNPLKMYAVSASGGLWISNDSAHTWLKTGTDNLPSTPCASVCIDYTNDNIIYLGTGDANYYGGSFCIWKSIDGGATWAQSTTGFGNLLPIEILMSPSNNNVLVAATDNGIYKSINAGANWSVVKSGGDFKDMQFKPGNNSILYATNSSEFWRSADFGNTWTQVTNGIVIPGGGSGNGMRIAVSAADTNVVYVGMVAGDGTILKSTDGGTSFTTVYHSTAKSLVGYDSTDIGGGQGDYNFSMTADPANANNVFLVSHIVWKSEDGGVNWFHLTDWWGQLHTDMHGIRFHPTIANKLYNVNDGGVWLSTDAGDNWIPRSDGIGATEIYHASQSPIKRDMISAGTQDNGELYFSANEWKTNRGGDWGSRSSFDYLTNNVVYISCGSKVYRSANKGSTFTNVTYNLPVGVNIIKIYHDEYNTNEAIYVCTAKGVYYKDASATSWQNISYNLPTVADIQDFMIYNPGTAASVIRVAYYGRGVWEMPINTSMPPAPDFFANTNTICPGQNVYFTDMSIGSPTSWNWSFAGGTPSSSNLQNPTVNYPNSGAYNVTLTISNSNGTNSTTQTSYITVSTTQSIPFAEGFTTSVAPSNWMNYDDGGEGTVWQQSTIVGGFGSSFESAFFDNYDYDANGLRDELRTPQYDFTSSSHPLMTFDRAYARYDGSASYHDSLAVLASADCGTTFTLLYLKGFSDLATAADNSGSMFIPNPSDWKKDTVDLISYAGQNNIMIAFQNRGHYGQSIYVDNINLSTLVGINELTHLQPISIFPNPSSGAINFSGLIKDDKIEIVDITGRVISQSFSTNEKQSINLSEIAKGIYFYRIINKTKIIQQGKISID